jgi:DNA transformation protein
MATGDAFADLFQAFGRIAVRRMFGGQGLFVDGLMIGIVMRDQIYLKTDDETRAAFVAEKCQPFSFPKAGKKVSLRYYAIPDRLLDDPEEFADWARQAERVARAKPVKKKLKIVRR